MRSSTMGSRPTRSAGKPTDAVIIGLFALKVAPDLIVSGINIGENLSFESVMTSGTVGAALEGANQGVPGIAFSLQVEDQGDKFGNARRRTQSFVEAGRVVRDCCERVFAEGYPASAHVINVNVPARPAGKIQSRDWHPNSSRPGSNGGSNRVDGPTTGSTARSWTRPNPALMSVRSARGESRSHRSRSTARPRLRPQRPSHTLFRC